MTNFVRVKLENGSDGSVSAEYADLLGLKPLDKPAARHGVALPAKHNPLKKSTTNKSGASAAAESEEKS